jgi:hypothetical protein
MRASSFLELSTPGSPWLRSPMLRPRQTRRQIASEKSVRRAARKTLAARALRFGLVGAIIDHMFSLSWTKRLSGAHIRSIQ